MKPLLLLLFSTFTFQFSISTAFAISDPLQTPNNKVGIHIISPTDNEASKASELVNKNGDWGYVTVVLERKDRQNLDKWQTFFNQLRRYHLIPLVRLATQPENDSWQIPYDGEETEWADFLDKLIWPTKNRYIIVFNEPNHAKEWGGKVDPESYAYYLDKTILALKNKNPDFFLINAGFDASAPQEPPNYLDQVDFMKRMNQKVPGIFNKLDGWSSHSYPQPEFSGPPTDTGRGSIRTWIWEQQLLKSLGAEKTLPVFITETGWKHAEGQNYNPRFLSTETVSKYLKTAFDSAWNSPQIIAVTPFLLNYENPPFDHFSFTKKSQNPDILGETYPKLLPHSQTLADLPKQKGQPLQEKKASLVKTVLNPTIVANQPYTIPITFKNTGQSIWNDNSQIKLVVLNPSENIEVTTTDIPLEKKVEPNNNFTFYLNLKAKTPGSFKILLNLAEGDKQFESPPLEYTFEAKSPITIIVRAGLDWKKDFSGEYQLETNEYNSSETQKINLNNEGESKSLEAYHLVPNQTYKLTLSRQNYKAKTITQTLQSGVNILDFGKLDPDFFSTMFDLGDFWRLLPFSH